MKHLKLEQLINRPMQVTSQSSTIIDQAWCNNPLLYARKAAIENGLSDQALIFICRKRAKISKEKVLIEIRSRQNFCAEDFAADVAQTDWSPILNSQDIDTTSTLFHEIFLNIIDKHMPIINITARKNRAPWGSNEFLSLIDTREHKAIIFKQMKTNITCN